MRAIIKIVIAGLIIALTLAGHAQIINPPPNVSTITWTPTLTGFAGTGLAATGVCQQLGGIAQCVVNITGTGITAVAGSSTVSTPFNGTTQPATIRNTAATVSVSSLIALGNAMMQTNSNLAMPTITIGVPNVSIAFEVFTI